MARRPKNNGTKDTTRRHGFLIGTIVLVEGAASSAPRSGSLPRQRDIRRALIEADLVDCMGALPGQLLYSTQVPVCLWFLWKKETFGNTHAFAETARALAA
jgi:type I restriction enzyme M protein